MSEPLMDGKYYTREALKVLENNLKAVGKSYLGTIPKPTRWDRIRDYFSTLWAAIRGVDIYE